MGQSFYTSIGGIKAAQSQINVVADNLANISTVGFKESRVTFEDVYYNTMSSGSAPTRNLGGINPKQIGVGTQISSIDRNFTNGTTIATGLTTDMNIQGKGFFTVLSDNGEVMYTRAGNFTLDGNGNLCLPNGYKVLGTSSMFSTKHSNVPIKLPLLIDSVTSPNTADIGTKDLNSLNNGAISKGTFSIDVTDNTTTPPTVNTHEITIEDNDNLNSIVTKVNNALGGAGTAALADGKFQITAAANQDLAFKSGSSNFVSVTEINTNSHEGGVYTSGVLDYKQTVNMADNPSTALKYAGFDVYENGAIEVKYENGDKLTVIPDENDNLQFRYTTAEGAVIMGNDLTIAEQVAVPANLQLQIGNMVNPNGLIGEGGNTFSVGANCGDIFYGMPNSGGFGLLQTGAYEGSNVDMTKQFSDMILAQRAIEANSRVFSTQNQIMQTVVYLGQ